MERVSIIPGKLPIIVVAPHGYMGDDENTSIIAEHIAHNIDAYAVINRGWERDDKVDFMLDKADCNNVNHCHEDVVKEEFLDPIIRYKNRILQKYEECSIYYIHGMGNKHRQIVGDPNLDLVIGFGAGSPNSFSCEQWQKDLFMHLLIDAGFNPYEGKKGGVMSGWSRNNMNQLFRKWYADERVNSMQIEIVYDLRDNTDLAIITADYIGGILKQMLQIHSFTASKTYKSY